MKNFYLLILTAVFLSFSLWTQAQVYASIVDNSANHWTLDDGRYWQGGVAPGNPCVGCAIYINSNVTMVPDNGTSTAFPVAGSTPALNHVTLKGCVLRVNGNVTLTVNTYLDLQASPISPFTPTTVVVGSDMSTAAGIILNDQADVDATSTIQLGNENCFIDATNSGSPPNPINGPRTLFTTGIKYAGIYYINAAYTPYGYTAPLTLVGNGSSTSAFARYNLNCAPAIPGSPNNCGAGIVFGPATTTLNGAQGLIFTQSSILPVELVQFMATKNADASIKLSWATAQEINSASFDIERSADQGSWEKIGSVVAKGYSSTTANYSYTDQFPLAGNNYYRLKMIDLDAKFQYSKVVVVSSDNKSQPLVVYSNPFSDQIRVKVNVDRSQNLTLVVSDIIGKTYLKQSYHAQAGDNLINLVPTGAASGMYVLHIEGNTYDQTVKLAKQ